MTASQRSAAVGVFGDNTDAAYATGGYATQVEISMRGEDNLNDPTKISTPKKHICDAAGTTIRCLVTLAPAVILLLGLSCFIPWIPHQWSGILGAASMIVACLLSAEYGYRCGRRDLQFDSLRQRQAKGVAFGQASPANNET